MNWMEQLLQIDPDAGSGLFEVAVVLMVALALGLGASRLWRRSRRAVKVAPRRGDLG